MSSQQNRPNACEIVLARMKRHEAALVWAGNEFLLYRAALEYGCSMQDVFEQIRLSPLFDRTTMTIFDENGQEYTVEAYSPKAEALEKAVDCGPYVAKSR